MRYGPFGEERDENGKIVMPEDTPLRETDGEAVNHREPPTRVRYPIKRVTTTEMRKRVRNMLEFVGRVQSDESRRAERAQLIRIPTESAPRPKLPPLEEELNGTARGRQRAPSEEAEEEDVDMREPSPEVPPTPLPSSSQLLDELTRDLIAFQEAFQTGDFGSLSFVIPPRPEHLEITTADDGPVSAVEAASKAEPLSALDHELEPMSAIETERMLTVEVDHEPMDVEPQEAPPLTADSETEVKPELSPISDAPPEPETEHETEAAEEDGGKTEPVLEAAPSPIPDGDVVEAHQVTEVTLLA